MKDKPFDKCMDEFLHGLDNGFGVVALRAQNKLKHRYESHKSLVSACKLSLKALEGVHETPAVGKARIALLTAIILEDSK